MTNNTDLQRSLGRVEGSLEAAGQRMDKLEKAVEDGFEKVQAGFDKIDARLAEIERKEEGRRTTWKIIVTIAATVSGFVAWAATWLTSIFK